MLATLIDIKPKLRPCRFKRHNSPACFHVQATHENHAVTNATKIFPTKRYLEFFVSETCRPTRTTRESTYKSCEWKYLRPDNSWTYPDNIKGELCF